MTILASFREPRQLAETVKTDGWNREYFFKKPYPFVILVTDYVMECGLAVARRIALIGYRPLEYDILMRATRYVRPLPLWFCHELGIALYHAFWGSLRWLYRHGVIRLACDASVRVRLRDIRPWPMRGSPSR